MLDLSPISQGMTVRFVALFLTILLLMSFVQRAQSSNIADGFSYEGTLYNSTGTSTLNGLYDVKFEILNPAADCTLYTKEFLALNLTDGFFSVSISGLSDLAPNNSITTVFNNRKMITGDASACSYTPVAGDFRKLRISVKPNGPGTYESFPVQTLNGVPSAHVAETLQGTGPQNFVQIYPAGIPGATGFENSSYAIDGSDGKLKQYNSGTGIWNSVQVLNTSALTSSGATANQVLKWNAVTGWTPANDNDTAAGNMAGDVTGAYGSNVVEKIQGKSISATAPTNGQSLIWNNSTSMWEPTTLNTAPTGPASGDLVGTYPNPNVAKIQGISIQSGLPSADQILRFDGSQWKASSDSTGGTASGDLAGTYPNPTVAKIKNYGIDFSTAPSSNQFLKYNGTNWVASDLTSVADGTYLRHDGAYPMSGTLDLGNNAIKNVTDPTSSADVATKYYSDTFLAGSTVSISGITDGQVLQWNELQSKWLPATISGGGGSPTGSAGGDLAGTYPNPNVAKIQGFPVQSSTPNSGNALVWSSGQWQPFNIDSVYVNVSGDTISSLSITSATIYNGLNMSGSSIYNLAAPADDTQATNKLYVNSTIASLSSQYLSLAGNTMEGIITFSDTATSGDRALSFKTNATDRWWVGMSSSPELGGDVGGDFVIKGYNDAGTLLGDYLKISRKDGLIGFGATGSTVNSAIVANSDTNFGFGVWKSGNSLYSYALYSSDAAYDSSGFIVHNVSTDTNDFVVRSGLVFIPNTLTVDGDVVIGNSASSIVTNARISAYSSTNYFYGLQIGDNSNMVDGAVKYEASGDRRFEFYENGFWRQYLRRSSDTLDGNLKIQGSLDMSNNRISNLYTPTLSNDAANKQYVDSQFDMSRKFQVFNDMLSAPANSLSAVGVAPLGDYSYFNFSNSTNPSVYLVAPSAIIDYSHPGIMRFVANMSGAASGIAFCQNYSGVNTLTSSMMVGGGKIILEALIKIPSSPTWTDMGDGIYFGLADEIADAPNFYSFIHLAYISTARFWKYSTKGSVLTTNTLMPGGAPINTWTKLQIIFSEGGTQIDFKVTPYGGSEYSMMINNPSYIPKNIPLCPVLYSNNESTVGDVRVDVDYIKIYQEFNSNPRQ